MIAKLSGILDSIGDDWAVVDIGGVGYLVFCSTRTLAQIPASGEAVSFLIETHIREDHIHLYGFLDQAEREWFKLLTTVQGVGAKVGLGIQSVLGPKDLTDAILAKDRGMISRAPGVGPKLATRLLTELRDKVGGIASVEPAMEGVAATKESDRAAMEDAVSALANLGYRRGDAFGAVTSALSDLGDDASVEDLIRAGLKELTV
ncbi:MAG: Holliday junction branch migration protein RuvA [Rhodospirillaceae bacterium]|nr:Holliday junction branch migration protein RuvA [Rhodospirillaceae bacterium]|tara:strand:+ start:1368 stop:1979 length:612 start_codon:yes stop_codon:yes gene_type:complete